MEFGLILEWILKSLVIILAMTGGFAYLTWMERKVLARMQVRYGPNRAGPFGLFQPVADGIKLIFKEELIPGQADKFLFILAPVLTVIPALIITAVIPWGDFSFTVGGQEVTMHLANVNVGVLYILSVTSISVYGITLAGWASNNKYATMGGLRATAQMISYELAMGFSVMGPIMMAGSLGILDIVRAQKPMWYIVLQPVAFVIFYIVTLAEVNRAPFDMPEAEQELVAGYHSEYSGMKFALFFMAEYIKMIAVAIIGSSLFLGGFQGPFIEQLPWLGPIYLFIKVIAWLFTMIWIRATLPRIRYDRLMSFGWKILFPIALLNVIVTAAIVLLIGA